MDHSSYSDDYIGGILHGVRSIAVVGASANEARPSFLVVKYLAAKGYQVFPVNPGLAGGRIAGLEVHARLADIRVPVDMVDIFRNCEAAGAITDEALALVPLPKVIWMQLSVINDAAAARAEAAGLKVVMDRCPKIEYGRLSGEIGWAGVNSRTISARRPALLGKGVQQLGLRVPSVLDKSNT